MHVVALAGLVALAACSSPASGGTGSGSAAKLHCPYEKTAAGSGYELAYRNDCTRDADCAIGNHLMDCCGTLVALGVRTDERARFAGRSDVCGTAATCKCEGRGVLAEDGKRAADDRASPPRDVRVACVRGRCATSIIAGWKPPPTPAPPPARGSGSGSAAPPPPDRPSGCTPPSPADCSNPATCKPSTCICRDKQWVCTPDCGGCRSGSDAPRPVRAPATTR